MAKLVLDCVTVSEIGVGGHSYGQDPVVGVHWWTPPTAQQTALLHSNEFE